jgi:rubrerythrin
MEKMTIDEAIKAALQCEGRVVAVYRDAVDRCQDPIGKQIFKALNEDEISHVYFLEEKLDELRETGHIQPKTLATVVPSYEKIEAAIKAFRAEAATPMAETELKLLRRALAIEVETSELYQRLVRELPAEERGLFERFVEIEEGHKAIVQAEIDSISGSGFWFDVPEFRLEAG